MDKIDTRASLTNDFLPVIKTPNYFLNQFEKSMNSLPLPVSTDFESFCNQISWPLLAK